MNEQISRYLFDIIKSYKLGKAYNVMLENLLYSNKPLSVYDLKHHTNYCRSTISLILSNLTNRHIVSREKVGKKYVYTLNENFLIHLDSNFFESLRKKTEQLKKLLAHMENNVKSHQNRLLIEVHKFEKYLQQKQKMVKKPW